MNKKILRILLFFTLPLIMISFIDFSVFDNEKEINVTIDNNKYSLPLGTIYGDVVDDDNQYFSTDYVLYDGQIIDDSFSEDTKISLNNADIEKLIELPGIGEKTALKIIEYRNKYGGFKSIDEIKNISGIGDKKYAKIKDLITV